MRIDFTLIADGTSDRALIPILRWLIRQHVDGDLEIGGVRADLQRLRSRPTTLKDRIHTTLKLYNPDILFIHRDAEKEPSSKRMREIEDAAQGIKIPAAKVVPVRMTEAWLLVDEMAIRKASGNPAGKMPLKLPKLNRLEGEPDPKKILHDLLSEASALPARRKFPVTSAAGKVADYMDCTPLRNLESFQKTETDTRKCLESLPGIRLLQK